MLNSSRVDTLDIVKRPLKCSVEAYSLETIRFLQKCNLSNLKDFRCRHSRQRWSAPIPCFLGAKQAVDCSKAFTWACHSSSRPLDQFQKVIFSAREHSKRRVNPLHFRFLFMQKSAMDRLYTKSSTIPGLLYTFGGFALDIVNGTLGCFIKSTACRGRLYQIVNDTRPF